MATPSKCTKTGLIRPNPFQTIETRFFSGKNISQKEFKRLTRLFSFISLFCFIDYSVLFLNVFLPFYVSATIKDIFVLFFEIVMPMLTFFSFFFPSKDLKDYFRTAGEVTYTNAHKPRHGEG